MKEEYRLAIYISVTSLIEAPCILIMYMLGFSNGSSNGLGYVAETIALNVVFLYLALSAIGGPPPTTNQQPLSPLLVWGAGIFTMFIIVTVTGETINWLVETAGEMVGPHKKALRFNKKLKSAVHDFVRATYSSEKAQKEAEATIKELYSEHPELVDKQLSETLERTERTGSAKTADRVRKLTRELHGASNEEPPSEKRREPKD
jgi:hypothetical protein